MSFLPHEISADDVPDGAVFISPDNASPLAVNMVTPTHQLFADEPERLGGKDAAPNPYDFLHSGLGSCTAITMRFYARKHKIALNDFHVVVSSRRNEKGELIIHKEIIFHDKHTEQDLEHLKRVSSKCPMHKDLARSIEIVSDFKVMN